MAVWVDFCCIDQDGAPASELDNLGNLIADCDMILTPVVDHPRPRVVGTSEGGCIALYDVWRVWLYGCIGCMRCIA